MSDLAAIFDSESLDAIGPEARPRLDAAAALVRAEPADCVVLHTSVISDLISARITVWRATGDTFVGETVSIGDDGKTFAETTFETRDATSRPLTRRLEVDGRVEATDVWKYAGGTLRHVHEEPLVDTRSVHVERAGGGRVSIAHDYREGPFHKMSTTDVAVDDVGRPLSIDVLEVENRERRRCGSTYAWTGLDATFDFTCDGEVLGSGTETRDAQGRPVARATVMGTGDNEWLSAYSWTWGPYGLVGAKRAVPFLGAVAQAWVRDDTGRIVAGLESGEGFRVVDLRSAACPVEEPVVARWIGDEPG